MSGGHSPLLADEGQKHDGDTFYDSLEKRPNILEEIVQPQDGMDVDMVDLDISGHVSLIRRWISSFQLEGTIQRGFFGMNYKTRDLHPDKVAVNSDLVNGLRGLDACLLAASRGGGGDDDNATISSRVKHMVETVAKIPSLMKSIMLIEDLKKRAVVLSSPTIRRVMLCRYSIMSTEAIQEEEEILAPESELAISSSRFVDAENRSWILEICQKDTTRFHRIFLDYLEIVSDLNIRDFCAFRQGGHISEDDLKEFHENREALFRTVSNFRRFVPYIASLSHRMIEEVSVTAIVHHAIDDGISTPFSTITMFLDLTSRILLLYALPRYVEKEKPGPMPFFEIDNFDFYILQSCGYLAFRTVIEIMGLLRMSRKLFFMNFFNFWNAINFFSIVMVYLGLFMEGLRHDFYGITTGLLWLSLVGFLKITNKDFAIFILSITTIMEDLILFLVLIFVFVVAFGDMLLTLFSLSAKYCIESLPGTQSITIWQYNMTVKRDNNNTCPEFYENYFKLYRVFVGDVSFEDFEDSTTITNLYLLFTFASTVIAVNMLIAKAYDAYERSAARGPHLFGRACLIQVAQTNAYEVLLHPTDRNYSVVSSERLWKNLGMMLFVLFQAFVASTCIRSFGWGSSVGTYLLIVLGVSFVLLLVTGWAFTAMLILVLDLLLFLIVMPSHPSPWMGPLIFVIVCLQVQVISLVMTGWREDWRSHRWPYFKYFQYNPIVKYVFFWPIHWFVNWSLLGRRRAPPKVFTADAVKKANAIGTTTDDELDENGEWKKRLAHVQDRVRLAVSKSETEIRNELGSLTSRIHRLESSLNDQSDQCREVVDNHIDSAGRRLKLHRGELLASFKERIVTRLKTK